MHAGAGGAGSAALQLGVHAGARVFATAGSPEKTKLCLELGAELAINYRETDFAEAVLDATDGRGVDVAFDAVSGDVTLQTFRCMAFNGRHILAGFASGIEQEDEGLVPRPVLFGNFSLVGVCHAYVDDPVVFKRLTRLQLPVAPRRRAAARRAAGAVRGGQAPPDRRPGGAVRRAPGRARRDGATPDRRPHRGPAAVEVSDAPAGYWKSPWPGEDGGPLRRARPVTGVGPALVPEHVEVVSRDVAGANDGRAPRPGRGVPAAPHIRTRRDLVGRTHRPGHARVHRVFG